METKQKIVIGLVGQKGGGKGTFSAVLGELLANKSIAKFKSSDILLETFNIWGITPTRDNFHKLAVAMDQAYGQGTLTQAMEHRLNSSDADIVIFDGVRWDTDVHMLKKFSKNIIVYVTADPKIRHERSLSRNEKAGENEASFEQFMKEEEMPTEVIIPTIGAQADFIINNNGSLEDFKKQVEEFVQKYLK